MKKFRFIALILALILVVGMTTGLIVRKQTGGQTVMQHSGGGSPASTTPATSVAPEGVYLYVPNVPIAGFTLQIDGETVIQDSDHSGIRSLAGTYCSTTSSSNDGAVYILPNDGVTLTIGGTFESEDAKSGARPLTCYVFYYDGTFDSYSARSNDEPVSIILPANVQFVCVMNEYS